MSDYPELLKQLALKVIDGIPLDAAKSILMALSDQHPIHLQWVPSHVGLSGNEGADDLAKRLPAILRVRKTTCPYID
ncbi:hypothetical protein TNCV_2865491 [Trichonephila clavipes]|nr:hypothetical protein TNCV_2865491 [Trichonephila clavipes]